MSSIWGRAAAQTAGEYLAAGTPEAVARCPTSVTGPWLAEYLGMPVNPWHTKVPAEELQG